MPKDYVTSWDSESYSSWKNNNKASWESMVDYGFYPYMTHQHMSQVIQLKFPSDGPDEIPSWSVFNNLIKACLSSATW